MKFSFLFRNGILFLLLTRINSWNFFTKKQQKQQEQYTSITNDVQSHLKGQVRSHSLHKNPNRKKQRHGVKHSTDPQIVGFWNMVINNEQDLNAIKEQRLIIESSGLMDRLDNLYYTTSSTNESFHFSMTFIDEITSSPAATAARGGNNGNKMKRLHHSGSEVNELKLLGQLYQYCHNNLHSKVLYFHNFGSYQRGDLEDPQLKIHFRHALDCFVLNNHCIEQLDTHDVCGMRITIIPHVHFGGNYWWSRCSHVTSLLPPTAPLRNNTFLQATAAINNIPYTSNQIPFFDNPYLGFGKYFTETWITSLPNFTIADCLTRKDSSGFIKGPRVPKTMMLPYCPNMKTNFTSIIMNNSSTTSSSNSLSFNTVVNRLSYGKKCSSSTLLYETSPGFGTMMNDFIASNAKYSTDLIKRSFIWYGQEPILYLDWMNKTLGSRQVAITEEKDEIITINELILNIEKIKKNINNILLEHFSNTGLKLKQKKYLLRLKKYDEHIKKTKHLHTIKKNIETNDYEFQFNNDSNIVGFWNIFIGKYSDEINKEQKFVLESSGLLDKLDLIYYITIGINSSSYRIPGKKMKHLHHYEKGFEFPTLNLIYKFCSTNPNSKVLYFHNKGSANYHPTNTNFRKALDCNNLHMGCIEQLNRGFDVCGWRITPLPYISFSGNYWWATCKHINKLIPPISSITNQTFLNVTSTINPRRVNESDLKFHNYPNLGLGRYFAESWVTSLPSFTVADCFPAELNNEYIFGYGIPWGILNEKCPNWKISFQNMIKSYEMNQTDYLIPRLSYGMKCSPSDVFYHPEKFANSKNIQRYIEKYKKYFPVLVKRSLLWYGQLPSMHLKWLQYWNITIPNTL